MEALGGSISVKTALGERILYNGPSEHKDEKIVQLESMTETHYSFAKRIIQLPRKATENSRKNKQKLNNKVMLQIESKLKSGVILNNQ